MTSFAAIFVLINKWQIEPTVISLAFLSIRMDSRNRIQKKFLDGAGLGPFKIRRHGINSTDRAVRKSLAQIPGVNNDS